MQYGKPAVSLCLLYFRKTKLNDAYDDTDSSKCLLLYTRVNYKNVVVFKRLFNNVKDEIVT